ncbi:MAG TPA: hypothetical protein VGM66_10500 [Candidatus Udaeobacter sp.]
MSDKTFGQKLKDDAKAVAEVATDALDAAKDFHTEDDNKPVKDQKWAKEIEEKK